MQIWIRYHWVSAVGMRRARNRATAFFLFFQMKAPGLLQTLPAGMQPGELIQPSLL